jgi:uncharacterized sulfatase
LHDPLVVYIPEKFKELRPPEYKAGGRSNRLVSFVDFAPTVLSLAGIPPPGWMQGHAFLGDFAAAPRSFLHGFRGRMDERCDLVRSITDGRYVYIRNYMPHLIYGQHIDYMFQTPTTPVWKRLHEEGKLTPAQSLFWKPKPPEELYDLEADPDEVNNLADSPAHRETKARLREAQQDLALKIRDLGFMPEGERFVRAAGGAPFDFARDESRYPLGRVLETAELASMLRREAIPALKNAMNDSDGSVRYWAALGLLMRGEPGVNAARPELDRALADPSAFVRITAAQALAQFGGTEEAGRVLPMLADYSNASRHDLLKEISSLIMLV